MPYELIPFPLSLIFILIFGIVIEAALWKLRSNGSVYRWLSNLAIAFGAGITVLTLYVILKPII